MNVAVLGCGAIGGVVAACLSRAGVRVTPITGNAAIAEAIRSHGYRVRDLDGTEWSVTPTAEPRVAPSDMADMADTANVDTSGRETERFDVVVIAVPSTRLEEAMHAVTPHLSDDGVVLLCQNGLPEDRGARIVGHHRAIGCVVGWGASMIEPGRYVRTSRGGFQLGRLDDTTPSNIDLATLARLLDPAAPAIPAQAATDFAGVRWSKLAINCCTSTLGAVGGAPLGVLMRRRFVRRLALEIFAEVNAVAHAEGVKPALVGGTLDIERVAITDDERLLRYGSPSLLMKHSVLLAIGFKFRRMRSSMLYALERGRKPEIEYLNGEVVKRGQARGVPVPVNRALVDAVANIASGRAQSGVAMLQAIHEEMLLSSTTPPVFPHVGGRSESQPNVNAPS